MNTESFEELVARMRSIFRGEETYGEGRPAEQANQFRFDRMFDEIVRRARQNSEERGTLPEVDVLISLAGFSPSTTILAYEILQPRKVLVITSEKAEKNIDTIGNHLVRPGKLDHSGFRHCLCDPVNPLDIYNIICREVGDIRKPDADRPAAVIDITGGKKVMSGTAALAASQLDLPMCYVDGDYDNELRQPTPGTETLIVLPNPTNLFGDQEMQTAAAIFRNGAYGPAHERYKDLSDRLSDPTLARFLRDLAAVYRGWCNLELDTLGTFIDRAEQGLNDPRIKIHKEVANQLDKQFAFLRRLADKDAFALLLGFYLLGLHYRELERHDFAALLFYRTIEGCLKERLERAFAFDCREPDYATIDPEPDNLLAKCNELAMALGRSADAGLPARVGLMNAAQLLYASNDPLMKKAQLHTPEAVGHLLQLCDARNQSVLAHGYQSISPGRSSELQEKAKHVLRAFWQVHRPEDDIDKQCSILKFVRTIDE